MKSDRVTNHKLAKGKFMTYKSLSFTPIEATPDQAAHEACIFIVNKNRRGLYILRGTDPEGGNLIEIHMLQGTSRAFEFDDSGDFMPVYKDGEAANYIDPEHMDSLLKEVTNCPLNTASMPFYRHWYDLAGYVEDVYYWVRYENFGTNKIDSGSTNNDQ